MKYRNQFANRRRPSVRALRRAATPSPRQERRIVLGLRATAAREIKRGLAGRIAEKFLQNNEETNV